MEKINELPPVKANTKKIKSEVSKILNLKTGEGVSFEAQNIRLWKVYFYKERRENHPHKNFTFKKQGETTTYKVWRIS